MAIPDESERKRVLEWLREAPFDDLSAMAKRPDFSYDRWFAQGRALPHAVDVLIGLLAAENLERPSGDGMRTAYALGWIGDDRRPAIIALERVLGSRDVALRMEAAAALGRLGNAGVLPVLEKLLADPREDANVRANACIAIGRLGVASAEPVLRRALASDDVLLRRSAEQGLRLLQKGQGSPSAGKEDP